MCLVSDDRMVVVDYVNIAVKMVDVTTGRVLHQLKLEDQPWGVCKMSVGRVERQSGSNSLISSQNKGSFFIMNI